MLLADEAYIFAKKFKINIYALPWVQKNISR